MKKLLLATTMLVTAGTYAAAEVSVSGDARMGVVSTDGVATFSNRARIKFSGSGTTDSGISFGGSFRANEAADAKSGTAGSTFISGAFGKITMGGVDSGDAAAVGQLASVGYTGLGSGNSISYAADAGGDNGLPGDMTDASGARVLYTYSMGDMSVNASSAQLTDGGATAYGLGGTFARGAMTLAVGYGTVEGAVIKGLKAYDTQTGAKVDPTAGSAGFAATTAGYFETNPLDTSVTDVSLSATYVVGANTIKGIYQQKTIEGTAAARADVAGTAATIVHGHNAIDLSSTATSMGLSIVHKIDVLSLTAYGITTQVDADAALSTDQPTVSRYGVGMSYDLGGGASIAGGWATVDAMVPTAVTAAGTDGALQTYKLDSVSKDQFDFGVNLSF